MSHIPKPVILVVDDEQFMRDSLRQNLHAEEFTVVEAVDCHSALAAFTEFSPALVLLDLVMPGIDGFTTCQKIRSLPGGFYTPVLMVTGLDDADSINKSFEAGATDFISKSVLPELLVFRIRYLLRASQSMKNLAESEAKLAAAQRVANMGNWEWEPATGNFRGSEETFRILGCKKSPDLFSYTGLLIAIFPQHREMADSLLKKVGIDRTSCSFECQLGLTDGSQRLVRIQAWADPAASGKEPLILGTMQDITELKNAEDSLLLLKKAVDCLPIGLTISDVQGKIIYANPTEAQLHGYMPGELVGRDSGDFGPKHLKNPVPHDWVNNSGVWKRESVNLRRNGEEFPVLLTSIAVQNAEHNCLGIVTTCEDITNQKEDEKKIHKLAYYDLLTGLANRGTFQERLHQAIALAQREKRQIGLLFLDLDNFKDVNDTQGHFIGDKLLVAVTARLTDTMRGSDTLARLGGDEFVVVLPSGDGQEMAAAACRRILSVFSQPFELEGHRIYSCASIGIAIYPDDATDADNLFKCADTAMYHAKTEARGSFRFFSAEMNHLIQYRVALENGLRHGLDNNEFYLDYQPQWELKTGRMVGVEALLRWRNSEFGILEPTEFIPLAEKTGFIIPLGEWVLRAACLQAISWSLAGHQSLKVAINISGKQFRDSDFLMRTERIIRETGVNPETLEFEFTESVIMEKAERTIDTLRALRKMGIYLSIDDFGTGYSSLSYLKHFPIDKIKIDRSFIEDIREGNDAAAIVEAIISLSHSLNLKVIAEGVENAEQIHFLTVRNCSEVQGFFLARPMAASAIFEHPHPWKRGEKYEYAQT